MWPRSLIKHSAPSCSSQGQSLKLSLPTGGALSQLHPPEGSSICKERPASPQRNAETSRSQERLQALTTYRP